MDTLHMELNKTEIFLHLQKLLNESIKQDNYSSFNLTTS